MPAIGAVEIFEVKDQPHLKARIRSGDPDSIFTAPIDGLIEVRVFVPVEYGPDLIQTLERIGFLFSRRVYAASPARWHDQRLYLARLRRQWAPS
jgi:hypothetical protein